MHHPKRKLKAKPKAAKKKRRILPRRKKKSPARKQGAPGPHGGHAARKGKTPHPKPRTVAA